MTLASPSKRSGALEESIGLVFDEDALWPHVQWGDGGGDPGGAPPSQPLPPLQMSVKRAWSVAK